MFRLSLLRYNTNLTRYKNLLFSQSQQLRAKLAFFKTSIQHDLEQYTKQRQTGICESNLNCCSDDIFHYFFFFIIIIIIIVIDLLFFCTHEASEKMLKTWQENEDKADSFAKVGQFCQFCMMCFCFFFPFKINLKSDWCFSTAGCRH